MAFAQIGPLTSVIEGTATAVGAAMLLGGFAMGLRGVLLGRPRVVIETWALDAAYVAGIGGVVAILVDIMLRYSL